jgi:hypothetical protein
MRRRCAIAAGTLVLAASCSDLGGLVGGADGGDERDAAGDTAIEETGVAPGDAATDADASRQPRCVEGGALSPVAVTGGLSGVVDGSVCRLGAGLAVDGMGVGLDFPQGGPIFLPGDSGYGVAACAVFDLGAPEIGLDVVAWVRASPDACGARPCTDGGTFGCATGRNVIVLRSTDGPLHSVGIGTATTVFEPRMFALPPEPTRYVLVCRGSHPETGDDLEVDAIRFDCR